MSEIQATELLSLLIERFEQIIFLLQTLCLASCFLCGFVSMQLIIHAKNQKHMF